MPETANGLDLGLVITICSVIASLAVFFVIFRHENKDGQKALLDKQDTIVNNQIKILDRIDKIDSRNEKVDIKYENFMQGMREIMAVVKEIHEGQLKTTGVLDQVSFRLSQLSNKNNN